jgi:hypothetical protein
MIRGDQMLGKIETGERQSAGAAIGSDDRLHVVFKDFQRPSPQPKPAGALHQVLAEIGRHLNNESLAIKTIYDRLLAIEQQTKRRASGGFARYLLAVCIGAAAILAWQSSGEAAKQLIATKAPELGWSPETKQIIASWMQQFGWTRAGPESTAVQPSVPETQVATIAQTVPVPKGPATPSIDPEQVHRMALGLGALQQNVEQLAAGQDQIGRVIDRLQGAVAEILVKMPQPQPPPIPAAPAHKPNPVTPPSSRALVPPYTPPHQ